MVAQVLTQIKAKQVDKTFTYNIPDHLQDKIKIGIRVRIGIIHDIFEKSRIIKEE